MNDAKKEDEDKLRIDLIPAEAIFAIAEIMTYGVKKYEDRNWEKGMKWGRVFSALMRHMWAWWGAKTTTKTNFLFGDLDIETEKSHLWHAACCIIFLISFEERNIGEDDRVKHTNKGDNK